MEGVGGCEGGAGGGGGKGRRGGVEGEGGEVGEVELWEGGAAACGSVCGVDDGVVRWGLGEGLKNGRGLSRKEAKLCRGIYNI